MLERPPFTALASVYDAIMCDVEYDEWADFIFEFLLKQQYTPDSILDLACGTGNSTRPFAQRGFEVWGLDSSHEMLERARKKLPEVSFQRGDFTTFDLARRFSLITCLFDSLNNLIHLENLKETLRKIRNHLKTGGWFAADFNTRLGVRELWEGSVLEGLVCTEKGEEVHYHWSHLFDSSTGLGTVQAFCRVEGHPFLEIHTERGYDCSELIVLLEEAGFTRWFFYEYPDFTEPTDETPRAWVFAQA